MDKAQCSIDGCGGKVQARGWCPKHYQRWRANGDPGPAEHLRKFYPAGTLCSFDGCDRPRRKLDWCKAHYEQHAAGIELRPIRAWHTGSTCIVCAEPTGKDRGFRKYCSGRCQQLYYEHGDDIPDTYECVLCGGEFPFEVEGRRRVNPRVTQCRRCRQDRRKHGVSVEWLAQRDGTDCSICGEPVDMTLTLPDQMCPSVDHVIPRAKGGTNDPENLALAHFTCNRIKSDSGQRLGVSRSRR